MKLRLMMGYNLIEWIWGSKVPYLVICLDLKVVAAAVNDQQEES